MVQHHFLLVTSPAQGHLNPILQFAKRLIRMGVHVTLATTVNMHRRMNMTATITGLSFATFSDGYDDGYKPEGDDAKLNYDKYISELKRCGTESLTSLIFSARDDGGRAFTCLVYSPLLSWVAELARGLHLPWAMLWVQPATVFGIYYYYHKDDKYIKNKLKENQKNRSELIELPGLPSLSAREIPSVLISAPEKYSFILPWSEVQFKVLQEEPNSKVLVNTFEELEPEALRAVGDSNIKTIAIGPLIPSAFLDGKDPSDTCFGADLFKSSPSDEYMEWLDSKAESSVIYVSFGSMCVLSKRQMEEIARGLIDSGRPFLWVIREKEEKEMETEEEEEDDELSEYREELEEKGKIVRWCKQVEVLSHRSVGCFVTHCGWNSTVESLASGVPVVGFPQWVDQNTNGKLIEDVWKTGVRVRVNEEDEGVVKSEEIRRCLDAVMGSGDKGEEVRGNAKKWMDFAIKAVREGGSSHLNLRAFLDEVGPHT